MLARESDERNQIERSMLAEVDRLQLQVEQAKHDAEMAAQIGDTLHKEVVYLLFFILRNIFQVLLPCKLLIFYRFSLFT